jgi:hypothetical protein
MSDQKYHAWFSQAALNQVGFCTYKSESGATVAVTEVNDKPTPSSVWPDLKYVGQVTDFIGTHPAVNSNFWSKSFGNGF